MEGIDIWLVFWDGCLEWPANWSIFEIVIKNICTYWQNCIGGLSVKISVLWFQTFKLLYIFRTMSVVSLWHFTSRTGYLIFLNIFKFEMDWGLKVLLYLRSNVNEVWRNWLLFMNNFVDFRTNNSIKRYFFWSAEVCTNKQKYFENWYTFFLSNCLLVRHFLNQ